LKKYELTIRVYEEPTDIEILLMRLPPPSPSIIDDFEPIRARNGEKRWRSADPKRLYTWDSLHGEIEVFDNRGYHLGAMDPITGALIKPPRKGRRIDV